MKIELTNKEIEVNVKIITEALKTLNFNMKTKIKFFLNEDIDELELETILNLKVCKFILLESGFSEIDKNDIIILMKSLFEEELTLEDLDIIKNKLIRNCEKDLDFL